MRYERIQAESRFFLHFCPMESCFTIGIIYHGPWRDSFCQSRKKERKKKLEQKVHLKKIVSVWLPAMQRLKKRDNRLHSSIVILRCSRPV